MRIHSLVPTAAGIRQMAATVRPYGWIRGFTGANGPRGATCTTVWSGSHMVDDGGLVADSGGTPGFGRRLRRFALRLAIGAGFAAFVWLLSSAVSAGTASAAQNPQGAAPANSAPSGNDNGGLLGGLLGGLGNTLSTTVSGVTSTVSAVTSTVSSVTGGVVGGLVNGVGDTLQTVTGAVTGVVAPVTTGPSGGGTQVGSDPKPPVVVKTPAAPATHQTVSVPIVAPPAPAAVPAVIHHVTTSVAPKQVSTATPPAPALGAPTLPSRPLPDPAPQPAPTPAVPASFSSAGHGFHGPARHTLGASSSDTFAPFLAAFGVHAADSAAITGRSQGLPPTTPD
jgi:hypothetical protein